MSTTEIFEKMSQIAEVYITELDHYTDEQFNHKASEEQWSLAQMYEHICMASMLFKRNIEKCLARDKGSYEGEKNKNGVAIYEMGGFPAMKITPPQEWQSAPVGKPKAEYADIFKKILADYQALIEKVEKDDQTYKTLHPVLGHLTAKEWFVMNEFHSRHHLRQKKELDHNLGLY